MMTQRATQRDNATQRIIDDAYEMRSHVAFVQSIDRHLHVRECVDDIVQRDIAHAFNTLMC